MKLHLHHITNQEDRRIRIRTYIILTDPDPRGLKHTDPTDPDPQHCLQHAFALITDDRFQKVSYCTVHTVAKLPN
jgi:hypothetical protein